MEKLSRVFFHELGHFVARRINFQYYEKGFEISEMRIYPCPGHEYEYCGHITPIRPEGYPPDLPVPKERLIYHIASISYGCFFQSYWQKIESFTDCLDKYGERDVIDWFNSLKANGLSDLNTDFSKVEKEYYESLINEKSLENFMKIIPDDYLINVRENEYEVQIDKLLEATQDLILEHFEKYSLLIAGYQEILENNC